MHKWENFTADRIEKFNCKKGRQQSIFWDGKTPGLGIRVTSTGAKAFIFETRLHNHTLRVTIGNTKIWSIGKAQIEARRIKALTDQGIDPRLLQAQKRAENEAKYHEANRRNLTVAAAWDTYIKARRSKWSARHLTDHKNISHPGGELIVGKNKLTVLGALAELMPLKLADINPECIKTWLSKEADRRPTQAALAFRLLRAFLNWCADTPDYREIVDTESCKTRIAKDTLPKKVSKTDCLQQEQLPAWFSAVRAINNPVISTYLQTLLLIGSRREEMANRKGCTGRLLSACLTNITCIAVHH